MFEFALCCGGRGNAGQVNFVAVGTKEWTVPDGVTSICVAGVGGGGGGGWGVKSYKGSAGRPGVPGTYYYLNAVNVTPGEVLTIVVGNGGPRAGAGSATSVTRTSGAVVIEAKGGAGGSSGSSGTYGSEYNPGWPGESAIGIGGLEPPEHEPYTYGYSGAGGAGYGAYDYNTEPGHSGAVRILWGAGREFPNTNTKDVK